MIHSLKTTLILSDRKNGRKSRTMMMKLRQCSCQNNIRPWKNPYSTNRVHPNTINCQAKQTEKMSTTMMTTSHLYHRNNVRIHRVQWSTILLEVNCKNCVLHLHNLMEQLKFEASFRREYCLLWILFLADFYPTFFSFTFALIESDSFMLYKSLNHFVWKIKTKSGFLSRRYSLYVNNSLRLFFFNEK